MRDLAATTGASARGRSKRAEVLFVADLFHPVDDLAVELFLNGNMRHGRGRRGTMPMLLAWREPDHIAGMDLLNGTAPAFDPPATARDTQGLAERLGRPPCSISRLQRD